MTTFTTKLMQLAAHEGPFCVENFGQSQEELQPMEIEGALEGRSIAKITEIKTSSEYEVNQAFLSFLEKIEVTSSSTAETIEAMSKLAERLTILGGDDLENAPYLESCLTIYKKIVDEEKLALYQTALSESSSTRLQRMKTLFFPLSEDEKTQSEAFYMEFWEKIQDLGGRLKLELDNMNTLSVRSSFEQLQERMNIIDQFISEMNFLTLAIGSQSACPDKQFVAQKYLLQPCYEILSDWKKVIISIYNYQTQNPLTSVTSLGLSEGITREIQDKIELAERFYLKIQESPSDWSTETAKKPLNELRQLRLYQLLSELKEISSTHNKRAELTDVLDILEKWYQECTLSRVQQENKVESKEESKIDLPQSSQTPISFNFKELPAIFAQEIKDENLSALFVQANTEIEKLRLATGTPKNSKLQGAGNILDNCFFISMLQMLATGFSPLFPTIDATASSDPGEIDFLKHRFRGFIDRVNEPEANRTTREITRNELQLFREAIVEIPYFANLGFTAQGHQDITEWMTAVLEHISPTEYDPTTSFRFRLSRHAEVIEKWPPTEADRPSKPVESATELVHIQNDVFPAFIEEAESILQATLNFDSTEEYINTMFNGLGLEQDTINLNAASAEGLFNWYYDEDLIEEKRADLQMRKDAGEDLDVNEELKLVDARVKVTRTRERYDLDHAPDLLPISLKRWSFSPELGSTVVNRKDFEFSRSFTLKGETYNLVAISLQNGGMDGGHYISYRWKDGFWHEINDDRVTVFGSEENSPEENYRIIETQEAFKKGYLAVYQKQVTA
jgi:hypothetical protein